MIDGCHTEPNNVDPVPTLGPYLPYPKVAHAIPSLGCLPQPQASAWLSGSQLLTPVVLVHSLPHRELLLVATLRVFKLAFSLVEEALHTIPVYVPLLLFFMCDSPRFVLVLAFLPAFCFSAIQHCLQAIAVHGIID